MIALLDTLRLFSGLRSTRKSFPPGSEGHRGSLRANEIHLSTISYREIALKFALASSPLTGCAPDDLVPVARRMGLAIAAPSAEEAAGFHRLPRSAHKDPFDRMLIWQCLRRDWTLLTKDRGLDAYVALGLKTSW